MRCTVVPERIRSVSTEPRAQFKGRKLTLKRKTNPTANNQVKNEKGSSFLTLVGSSQHSGLVCLLSVGDDGSLAEINTDRWRLMSLNTVNGLSLSNPV